MPLLAIVTLESPYWSRSEALDGGTELRLIVGGIMHETHTFSAEPTTLDTLETVVRSEELLAYRGRNHSLGGVVDACEEQGIELAPTLFASGTSTGTPDR